MQKQFKPKSATFTVARVYYWCRSTTLELVLQYLPCFFSTAYHTSESYPPSSAMCKTFVADVLDVAQGSKNILGDTTGQPQHDSILGNTQGELHI